MNQYAKSINALEERIKKHQVVSEAEIEQLRALKNTPEVEEDIQRLRKQLGSMEVKAP